MKRAAAKATPHIVEVTLDNGTTRKVSEEDPATLLNYADQLREVARTARLERDGKALNTLLAAPGKVGNPSFGVTKQAAKDLGVSKRTVNRRVKKARAAVAKRIKSYLRGK